MQYDDVILTLAPVDLRAYRTSRYDGGGYDVPLGDFAPEDAARLVQIYAGVKTLYDAWLYMKDAPRHHILRDHCIEFHSERFRNLCRSLGSSTYARGKPPGMLRKVVHDVRGGALITLIGYAGLLERQSDAVEYIRRCVFLARDHAKMMRNAIRDIDPLTRAADESERIHRIDDVIAKWHDCRIVEGGRTSTVHVFSKFRGCISNRCLETSAIDRILYNYMNNAARHASDGVIRFWIVPVGKGLIRWVVQNIPGEDHRAWLRRNVGEDLRELFMGGLTRGGEGIGLSNCADFVASSFGLAGRRRAVDGGYCGARMIHDAFFAWFHWPEYVASASTG